MPRLSIWMVRTALVYFVLGISLGALLLIHKASGRFPALWALLPVHIEWMLIGWTQQLIMGVAFWMFPRMASGPPRRHASLAWLAYGLLNVGIVLVCLVPATGPASTLSVVGRLFELLSVLLFVAHLFPRVKPFGA